MNKKIFLLLVILVLAGCRTQVKEDLNINYSIKYNDAYYKIYVPYKKGISNDYMINSSVVDFDVETIEKELIRVATNVFDIDKYYYQEGQYLTIDHLKKLLDDKHLNKVEEREIDGHKIKPNVICGIYEKNFLDSDGNIKGMALGLVLNRYHAYDKNNNYVTLSEADVIDLAKKASLNLVEYIRDEFDLPDITIVVALYVESSPESNTSGNYLYYGIDDGNKLDFNYIDQKNFYMNTSNVQKLDMNNYTNFEKITKSIHEYDQNIYVSGLGHYTGNNLVNLEITVTKSYYSYGDLLYISQLLSEKIMEYFDNTKVVVEIKAMNDIKSYIVKEANETSADIFIY